jgi:hypothetical protein
MTFFNRYPTTTPAQMDRIRDAYKLAGVTEPSRALAIAELVRNTPTTEQITDELAQAALTAQDPDAFYADALARIQGAMAADAFRDTFAARLLEHGQRTMPHTLARTAEDLAPAFARLVKQMQAAVNKLPTATPLDLEANVENDTASEYKTTRDALAKIGQYVSVYIASPPRDIPTELNRILPAVNLPEAQAELVEGLARATVNEHHLAGTRTIRALADAALEDLDLALLRVARGDFPGATLSLATPDEMRAREANARTAYTQTLAQSANATQVH